VDNVVQFDVVTADGRALTVNSHQYPDLFWALRGGGGGTYAVVISATYITYDIVPLTLMYFTANLTSPTVAKSVLTEYVKLHPSLADAGWGGYGFVSPTNLSFGYLAPNISVADANKTIEPFLSFVQNQTTALTLPVSYDSFYEWYQSVFKPETDESGGSSFELGSRLLLRELAETDPGKVADVILSLGGFAGINFIAGGAVSKVDPDSTGVHPGWRRALVHIFIAEGWEEGDSASIIQDAKARLRAGLDKLAALGSVTYFNEASLYEKDFKETFFGAHYNRLKKIKNKYDPKGLFVVASGVGSDDWDASLNCRV